MSRFNIMLMLVALLSTGLFAQDDLAKKDADLIQGTWNVISQEWDGKPTSKENLKSLQILFKGVEMTIQKGDKILGKGTFKLDAAKNPKEIDYREGKDLYSGYDCGIYSLSESEVKLCLTADRAKRPTDFDSKQGMVWVLKRGK